MSISKGRVLNTTSLVDKVYLFDISSLYSELIIQLRPELFINMVVDFFSLKNVLFLTVV